MEDNKQVTYNAIKKISSRPIKLSLSKPCTSEFRLRDNFLDILHFFYCDFVIGYLDDKFNLSLSYFDHPKYTHKTFVLDNGDIEIYMNMKFYDIEYLKHELIHVLVEMLNMLNYDITSRIDYSDSYRNVNGKELQVLSLQRLYREDLRENSFKIIKKDSKTMKYINKKEGVSL